jgi:hypothetical protein
VLHKAKGGDINLVFDAVPTAIELSVVDGVPVETELSAPTQAQLVALLESKGVRRFRYKVTNANFDWEPGTVDVTFEEGTFAQETCGCTNLSETESFTVQGPVVEPRASQRRRARHRAAERAPVRRGRVPALGRRDHRDQADDRAGRADARRGRPRQREHPRASDARQHELRRLRGLQVRVRRGLRARLRHLTFAADAFRDGADLANTAQLLTFTVEGSTANLASPVDGSTIGLTNLQNQGYLDIAFTPATGAAVDPRP